MKLKGEWCSIKTLLCCKAKERPYNIPKNMPKRSDAVIDEIINMSSFLMRHYDSFLMPLLRQYSLTIAEEPVMTTKP